MKLQRHIVWIGVLSVGLLCPSAQAQDLGKAAGSLKLVPADAATYSVMLRNREQLEAVAKSKAWARLMALPFVKSGFEKLDEEWNRDGGQLAPLRQWYENGDGKGLVSLLGDLMADEVFFYGGKNSIEFLQLLQDINTANQLAPLAQLLEGRGAGNDPQARVRFLLQAVTAHADRIKVPCGSWQVVARTALLSTLSVASVGIPPFLFPGSHFFLNFRWPRPESLVQYP